MVVLGEVELAAEIETAGIAPAIQIRCLVKNFSAQRQAVGDFPLEQPAKVPKVPISRPGIDPITAAAIGRPIAPILLQPEGQELLPISCAEPPLCVARRYFDQRKSANLRIPVVFAWIDETQLRTQFGVTGTHLQMAAGLIVEGEAADEVKLQARTSAVVDFKAWPETRRIAVPVGACGE